jgi:membrane complex biogenesis BtpA family protein
MVHLPPLPGSSRWNPELAGVPSGIEAVFRAARRDAAILLEERVDGLLVENFGDIPFFPDSVPPITVAVLAALLTRLKQSLPRRGLWGINVLRNDAQAALSIAAATGADFIRVNVHAGPTLTDQGLLQGKAHETLRLRASLAPRVAILADAGVKHGRALAPIPLADEVAELVERGLADGVLITGPRTGVPPQKEDLEIAVRAAGNVPVFAASGISAANVARVLPACAGVIVGTSLKVGARTDAPVDRSRVRRFMAAARMVDGEGSH